MTRFSQGVGRYVAAEEDVYSAPDAAWAEPGVHSGAVYCGGVGQTATSVRTFGQSSFSYVLEIAARMPLLTVDMGGSATWGNDTAIIRLGQARRHLISMGAKSGKVYLVGGSMGALTALNWARTNLPDVAAIAMNVPALDLTDIHANNRGGYQAAIDVAYGGAYVPAIHEATHSPLAFAGSLTVPMMFWYGDVDPICLPAKTEAFAAAAPDCEIIVAPGGYGGNAYPATIYDDIVAFFAANP